MSSTLSLTVKELLSSSRGILACDESINSMGKRFNHAGITQVDNTRMDYFTLLFSCPQIEEFTSGVILYEDLLLEDRYQPLLAQLRDKGIIYGIRADQGGLTLPNYGDEQFTRGIDTLSQRLEMYARKGAGFVKWRVATTSSIHEGNNFLLLSINIELLAFYAMQALNNHLIPIVEIEVLYEGSHTQQQCRDRTFYALEQLMCSLDKYAVPAQHVIIKMNFITAGQENPAPIDDELSAADTAEVIKTAIPDNIGGVVFLSGGLPAERALKLLGLTLQKTPGYLLSYSFGRAFWQQPLSMWAGNASQVPAARERFVTLLRNASEALL
jgi:fructose-bisphosphate aldolase, class I